MLLLFLPFSLLIASHLTTPVSPDDSQQQAGTEHFRENRDLLSSGDSFLKRKKREAIINVTALQELKTKEECGRETRSSACRLLEAHNLGYVWLWPVALGAPSNKQTSLQTATPKASALNNVIDLCSGKKATAPYGNLKFCVCSTALDTIYTYAAEEIFFSLPVYSLTVLDNNFCSDNNMIDEPPAPISYQKVNSRGKTGALGMAATSPPYYERQIDDGINTADMSLMELPGLHTVDFSCGFADQASFTGAVRICSQVAQFCASAISRHQFMTAMVRSVSTDAPELPSVGIIEMLPFTEYQCGRKFPSQFSIRCTIPCSYTF